MGSNAGSATTSPSTTGSVQVLLGPTQKQGAWTSTPFTVGAAPWNIGWAYQCAPVPPSGPAFQIFVVPAGGSAGATPAVSETGASGSSVTPQSTTGSQQLDVQASTGCQWVVKVTGSP
jgi:hypothetical protein